MCAKKHLTSDTRSAILALHNCGKSQREIAKQLNVSQSTVNLWVLRAKYSGTSMTPGPKSRSGRPRKTNLQTDKLMKYLVLKNPSISAKEMKSNMNGLLSDVSERTIQQRLLKYLELPSRHATRVVGNFSRALCVDMNFEKKQIKTKVEEKCLLEREDGREIKIEKIEGDEHPGGSHDIKEEIEWKDEEIDDSSSFEVFPSYQNVKIKSEFNLEGISSSLKGSKTRNSSEYDGVSGTSDVKEEIEWKDEKIDYSSSFEVFPNDKNVKIKSEFNLEEVSSSSMGSKIKNSSEYDGVSGSSNVKITDAGNGFSSEEELRELSDSESKDIEAAVPKVRTDRMEFRCNHCEYRTIYKGDLITHIKCVHFKLKPFCCELCGYKASAEWILEDHVNAIHSMVKKYECTSCPFKAATKSCLRKHMKYIHLNIKPFKCSFCPYKANQKGNLKTHIEKVHLNRKPVSCSFCDYKANSESDLKYHVNGVHLKLKPFKCSECNYEGSRITTLNRHIKSVHLNLKPFKCSDCELEFSAKSVLNTHIKNIHSNLKPFQCSQCEFKANTKCQLQAHTNSIHSNIKPFQCSVCNYKAVRKSCLTRHSKGHSK